MRRALALAAAVVSARQDHLCAEDVCFYHVPKTGGDSFKYLATVARLADLRQLQESVPRLLLVPLPRSSPSYPRLTAAAASK